MSGFLGVRKKFDYLCNSVVFFSRPFNEISNFSNCPYDFYEILYSHSTPKGAPVCAKASKSYDWDVRNIAKISPKVIKKVIFDFSIFSKYDSNEMFYSHSTYTILESYMCNGIKIVWLGREKQPKLTQNGQKHIFQLFSIFSKTPYDSNETFYSQSTSYYGPLCAISINSYD